MKKTLATIALTSFASITALMPMRVQALVPPLVQFEGWATVTIPCTCSATFWTWFVPLYIGPAPVTGPVVYAPYATLPFANFLTSVPSVPHKGAFIPGVQACWMYAVVTCFPLPSVGVMGMVGTGLPFAK